MHEILLDTEIEAPKNISWGAYHAHRYQRKDRIVYPSALLPLFHENAHSIAMIRHSMDIIRNAVDHINNEQVPVITFDQPLYTIAKHIQWKWPEIYGEETFVIMLGGLHIKKAALSTVGDWLKGSGWTSSLVQADVTTPGTADSFLKVSHITRTRRALQITLTSLFILKKKAYENYRLTLEENEVAVSFEIWCKELASRSPHFRYREIVMEMESCILTFVHSLGERNFDMYLDAPTEFVPWLFALDHTNYARRIPVHLKDMVNVSDRHPEIANEFDAGHFTAQMTSRLFSAIALDQAHEQVNACIKGDGGAVGLTDNPNALRRWMVAGPEVARAIGEFQDSMKLVHRDNTEEPLESKHHEEIKVGSSFLSRMSAR